MMNTSIDNYMRWRAEQPDMQMGGKACESICYAPFTSLLLDPKGYVRTCCQSMTHSIGNITQQSLKEIWNDETNRGMRSLMRANELPEGCLTCQSDIEKGNFDQTFARLFDVFPVPVEQPEWPQNIWFLASNACNLECVQCYGELSSSIRKNRDKLPPLKRVYHDAFFEELREFLPHLRLALFLGGEAFLSRENFRIWDMMIEDGLTTESLIVTNGTQFNDRIVRVLSSLNCSVSISLDGATKETVESIRLNASFDEMMANIKQIQNYTSVELSFCIMPQNHHEFGDFLVLAEQMDCNASANTVHQPAEYSLCGLPREELARVVASWEARDVEMRQTLDRHRNLWVQELSRLKGWLENSDKPPGPLYLTGIASQMNALPRQSASGTDDTASAPDDSKAIDIDTALRTLEEWSAGGTVDRALLDSNDIVSGTKGSFGGLDEDVVNNRALSFVLMLLRERYGEDVNIVSEEWTDGAMDRVMEFISAERKQTDARWIALPSPGPAEHKTALLLAVRETSEEAIPRSIHAPKEIPNGGQNSIETGGARPSGVIATDTPDDLEIMLERACMQLQEERWREAAETLKQARAIHTHEPRSYLLLGKAAAALEDWELAAEAYAGAVERGAITHEIWSGLAEALARLGRLDSAQKAYEAAVNLNPSEPMTRAHFASTLIQLGQSENGLEQLERAVELGLENTHITRVRELLAGGYSDEAMAELEKVLT